MIQIEVQGTEIVVGGLESMTTGVKKAAFLGVIEGLQIAHERCREIISESDHSLKDLAEMGHPYGFKDPQQIHDPDESVHRQSGDYLDALTVEKPISYADADIIEGEVHIDDSMRSLDQMIQTGTLKMRARPWAERVITDHSDEMGEPILTRVDDALRAEGAR